MLKQIHTAKLYRDGEDRAYNIGFMLSWMLDDDNDSTYFVITSTKGDEEPVTIKTSNKSNVEKDFYKMVRMMKAMIRAKEVTIDNKESIV